MNSGTSLGPPTDHAPARPGLTGSPLAIDASYSMAEEALRQDRPLGYPPRDNTRGQGTPQMPFPIQFDSVYLHATVFPSRATYTLTQRSSAVLHENTSLRVLSQPQHASTDFPHALHIQDNNPPHHSTTLTPPVRNLTAVTNDSRCMDQLPPTLDNLGFSPLFSSLWTSTGR